VRAGRGLHVESVKVGCGTGGEYEAVAGAVDEANAVEVGDGVVDVVWSADFADQFVG
jgi:hypothetical protein